MYNKERNLITESTETKSNNENETELQGESTNDHKMEL